MQNAYIFNYKALYNKFQIYTTKKYGMIAFYMQNYVFAYKNNENSSAKHSQSDILFIGFFYYARSDIFKPFSSLTVIRQSLFNLTPEFL